MTMTTTGADDMRKIGEAGVMSFARRILPTPITTQTFPAGQRLNVSAPPFLFDIVTKIGVPTAGLNGKD